MRFRTRAIFVSGTFRDFHFERDWIASRVAPRIEERLAKLRTHLEWVDLRVGVETTALADDHAKQELVLKVCLGDVRRCRPFLVFLIGDRYGWVPPPGRAVTALEEVGSRIAPEGRSVTALEMEFGVWGDHDQPRGARIYLRELDRTRMPEDQAIFYNDEVAAHSQLLSGAERADAAERAKALAALKQRIRGDRRLAERCRTYRAAWNPTLGTLDGLDAFADQLVTDLSEDLERDAKHAATEAVPTTSEQFIAGRLRLFAGDARARVVTRLTQFADSDESNGRGLVLTGEAGAGKSAILAKVAGVLAGRPGTLVLTHAAGVGPRFESPSALLEIWLQALCEEMHIDDPPKKEGRAESKREAFTELLLRAASDRRVLLLIDGVDRIEAPGAGSDVEWLPPRLPPGVRLLATGIPGAQTAALEARGEVELEALQPLGEADARAIAAGIYARYHRQVNREAVDVLIAALDAQGLPCHRNALWIVTATEELNLMDADDFERAERDFVGSSDARLHAMVVARARTLGTDLRALFLDVFARLEASYGRQSTSAFLACIALARFGLRASDLTALVPQVARHLHPSTAPENFDAVVISALRRGLRAFLIEGGEEGRLSFQHSEVRAAATAAYLGSASLARAVHGTIARHLAGLPPEDNLREREWMFHLVQANDCPGATTLYANAMTELALRSATSTLVECLECGTDVEWVAGMLNEPGISEEARAVLAQRFGLPLAEALQARPNLRGLLRIAQALEACVRTLRETPTFDRTGLLAMALTRAAYAELNLGRRERSLELQREMLGLVRQAADQATEHITPLLRALLNYGDALVHCGRAPEALAAFTEVVDVCQKKFEENDGANPTWVEYVAEAHLRLGDAARVTADLDAAEHHFTRSMAHVDSLLDLDRNRVEWLKRCTGPLVGVGQIRQSQGRFEEALQAFQTSYTISREIVRLEPATPPWETDTVVLTYIGQVLLSLERYEEALGLCQEGASISAATVALDPTRGFFLHNACTAFITLGSVWQALDAPEKAIAARRQALRYESELVALGAPRPEWVRTLANCHYSLGRGLGHQAFDRFSIEEETSRQSMAEKAREATGVMLEATQHLGRCIALFESLPPEAVNAEVEQSLEGARGGLVACHNQLGLFNALTSERAGEALTFPPPTHSGVDPDQAAEKNIAYQAALAEWQRLPWLMRLLTPRPKPPAGI